MGYYSPRTRFVELFTRRADINAKNSFNETPIPAAKPVLAGTETQQSERTQSDNGTNRTVSSLLARTNSAPMFFGDYEYQGIYLLVEKIKRGKQRLNIQKLRKEDQDEPEITGGYVFKRDRLDAGERGFRTPQKAFFAFDEPKERNLTPAQAAWLTNYVAEFEHALFSEQFTDTTNGYARHIDVDSFIDYHWMTEVSRNLDGYWVSQYYHKDRGEKLKMGPVWDFDLAFGNAGNHGCHRTNGWHWEAIRGNEYEWFARLFEDPDFLQRYIDRWAELRTTVFATSNVLARIDRLTGELKEAQARNFQRWPILGKRIHISKYVGATYQDEVDWMRNWMAGRLAWIDSQDFPPPAMHVAKNRLSGTNEIRLACLVGKIYYATNGTDPRLRGGQPSPDAFEYRSPVQLPHQTPFTARIRSDEGLWSAPVKWEEKPANTPKDGHTEHR